MAAAAAAHAAICWHMASSLVEREPPEHCSISLAPEVRVQATCTPSRTIYIFILGDYCISIRDATPISRGE